MSRKHQEVVIQDEPITVDMAGGSRYTRRTPTVLRSLTSAQT